MDKCNTADEALDNKPIFIQKFFFIVMTLFSCTWLISNILAVKMVYFFGITLTGGFLTFPLATALNSLIVEVYGYKNARQAIWAGIILNLLYLAFINLINLIPPSPNWKLQNEFQSILIPSSRIIIASVISFWCSGFLNSFLMAKLKSKNFHIILRILFSTFTAITFDLTLYFLIAFWGIYSWHFIHTVFIFAYLKKILCEIIILPFLWAGIDIFKKIEGFEIYDTNTKFTPFSLDNVYYLKDYNKLANGIHDYRNL